jgi:catechol 2,3-dioxygenase
VESDDAASEERSWHFLIAHHSALTTFPEKNMSEHDLAPGVLIEYVYIPVTDLERSTAFYCDVLGLRLTVDGRSLGWKAVFLVTRDDRHHILLDAFSGPADDALAGGRGRRDHFAVPYADPVTLAEAVIRLYDYEYPISHAADHDGTVSIYLYDPDGNPLELYYDRPPSEQPRPNGRHFIRSEPFDPATLLEVLARRSAA